MATDETIRRKAEVPAGDSQSARTKMGQKMALVHQRLSSPDNGGRRVEADDDFNPMRKRDMPASDSQPARTKMGQQKMALVLSLLEKSSRHAAADDDYDVEPTDKDLAIVVGQQSMDVDDYLPPPPLRTVRPESLENGQEKCPGLRYEGAKKARTKKTSTAETYKGKRGRPAGSMSAKSNIEQKPALFESSSGSSSHSKVDKGGDFEPLTPTVRKRGRVLPKPSKRKTKQKPLLVDSSSSSSSEGMKDKDDDDFEPEVSDDDADDNGHTKYARVKGTAWNRAVEVEKKLPAQGPSFVKLMMHSQVVKGFWLGLPAVFCRTHLPKDDVKIVLEDEEGEICKTKYKAYKTGLSGGWHGFVDQHGLKVGDVLVFQLVQPTRFKVYILRENEFTTTDGALGLLSLDTSMENNKSNKEEEGSDEVTKSKEEEPEVVARVSSKPSNDDIDNLASKEAAGSGIRSPSPDTGDFINFKIVVGDGSVVGRRVLPDDLRRTYYGLCQDRKALLHRHLLKQISPTLAAGMIVETANIADGIRASSTASHDDLASWKKTLESFEHLGMDVAFMRKRVDDLLGLLSAPSPKMEEPEGYEELKLERAHAAEKVRALESRVSVLKDAIREMDVEMEQMVEASTRKKDQAVRKLATAPW